jgi:hypothetical protein
MGIVEQAAVFAADLTNVAWAISSVVNSFWGMASGMGESIDAAITKMANISTVVGIIKDGVTALTELFTYKGKSATDIQSAANTFSDNLLIVVEKLVLLANTWELEAMQAAAGVYSSMKSIIDIIKPGIEAVKELLEMKKTNISQETLTIFYDNLVAIVDTLKGAVVRIGTEGLALAEEAVKNMQSMLGVIKPGIEAVSSLIDLNTAISQETLTLLYDNLVAIVHTLKGVVARLGTDGLDLAAEAIKNMQSMLSIIKPGVEAVSELVSLDTVIPQETLTLLYDNLVAIVRTLEGVVVRTGTDGLSVASEAMSQIKGIIDIVKPGVEAVKALMDTTSQMLPENRLTSFKENLIMVVNALQIQLSQDQMIALQASAEVWKAVKDVISIIKPGIEAISALASMQATELPASKVTLLANDILLILGTLKLVGEVPGVNIESMTVLGELFGAIKTVMEAAKGAVEGIKAMAAYSKEAGLEPKMLAFESDFATVSASLEKVAIGLNVDAIDSATIALAATKTMVELVTETMDRIIDLQWSTADARRAFVAIGTDIETGITNFVESMIVVLEKLTRFDSNGTQGISGMMEGLRIGLEMGFERAKSVIAQGLNDMQEIFSDSISNFFNLGASAGYAWAEGFASTSGNVPSADYNYLPTQTSGGGNSSVTNNTTSISIPVSGVNINNGMDLQQFQVLVEQSVRNSLAIRR